MLQIYLGDTPLAISFLNCLEEEAEAASQNDDIFNDLSNKIKVKLKPDLIDQTFRRWRLQQQISYFSSIDF